MMEAMTREEWDAERAHTCPKTVGERMGLNEFAELCNKRAKYRHERWPQFRWDNSRYVCHLEDALSKGATIPIGAIESVADDELRYDGYAFPLLNAARKSLATA